MRNGLGNLLTIAKVVLLCFFISLYIHCDIINPKEDIPAYIAVDSITLSTSLNQGTSSHKISDVWVYINDQPLGAYEMPAKFPVLKSGLNKVALKSGIKINGIAASRGVYPFYKTCEYNVDLQPGKITKLTPSTTYYSETTFLWLENFENSGMSIQKYGNADTGIVKTSRSDLLAQSLNGYFAGLIHLTKQKPNAKVISTEIFEIPKKTVFVEFNYKNNQEFTAGYVTVYGSSVQFHPVLNLNPSSNWNKMYLNLTPNVNRENTDKYQIYFEASLDESVNEGIILLDNIKLIYL